MSRKEYDLLKSFDEYFHELEGYGLRSERFYDDMRYAETAHCKNRDQLLKTWLRAAYLRGARQMAEDTDYILGTWGTAMAGIDWPKRNPTEAYDNTAENLREFYEDIFQETEDKLNEAG